MTPTHIRLIRERIGWNRLDIAKFMGEERRNIEYWENGRKKIPPTAIRLYKLLHIHGERAPRLWDENDSYTDTAYAK